MKHHIDDIIEGCKSGNHQCQKIIFELYGPKMKSICFRYSKDSTEAEDILQEGFIKVFSAIRSFKGESSFQTWISRIFINTSISYIKSKFYKNKSLEQDIQNHENLSEDTEDTSDTLNFNQLEPEFVLDAIQELPDNYRLVLNLYAIDGFSHKQIAEQLDTTESNSKSRLSRARMLLKEIIKKKLS